MHIHARGLMSRSLLSRACSSEHFLRRYPPAPLCPRNPRSPRPVPALPRAPPFPLLAPYLPRNPSHIVPVLGGAREFEKNRFFGGSGCPRRVPEALNSRIHVVFRKLSILGGVRRPSEGSGSPELENSRGFSKPPEASGGSRRLPEAPGGSRRLPEAPGDPRIENSRGFSRIPDPWNIPKPPKPPKSPTPPTDI